MDTEEHSFTLKLILSLTEYSCSQLSYWNQWPLPSPSLTFSLLLDAFVEIPPSKNYMYFAGRALGKFLAWIKFHGLKKSYNENKIWASWCGGFNPEKYARQIGSFPSSEGENKKYLKPPPTLR